MGLVWNVFPNAQQGYLSNSQYSAFLSTEAGMAESRILILPFFFLQSDMHSLVYMY